MRLTAAELRALAAEMDASPEWENEPRDGVREMAWIDLMIEAQMVEEAARNRMSSSYEEFLRSKVRMVKPTGFDYCEESPILLGWQRKVVELACRRGRYAIFADCGLGKTAMQLEWAANVRRHTGGRVLIVAPLAVGMQTEREAAKFGLTGVYRQSNDGSPVIITNYERLESFDPGDFQGVILDESSILKSFTGSTKRALVERCAGVPYRLCCTATPAPNDHIELGNHAEFLGIMASNEMLSRWFVVDQGEMCSYRLKGHAEGDFWGWVASWAVAIGKPSDVGGDDESMVLPPLRQFEHIVTAPIDPAEGKLFHAPTVSATDLYRELRRTADIRVERAAALINDEQGDMSWVVWCNTNEESAKLAAAIPDAVEVVGSHSPEEKQRRLATFLDGEARVLVTKPSIAGFGLNFQYVCRRVCFVGVTYSFEAIYQAMRRVWRFGQTEPVEAHFVVADTEGAVLETIARKERDHGKMTERMREAMRGKSMGERDDSIRTIADEETETRSGFGWTMTRGDCLRELERVEPGSVGFSIFSPPFSGLYIYSDYVEDMGNCADDEEFFEHFGRLPGLLLRATEEGRLCAVHCKDLPRYRNSHGAQGLRDFPGRLISAFEAAGWVFHSRVTIWKCPVVEMERTKTNGLLHKTIKRDSTQSRQGMADYLIVFRKSPVESNMALRPVTHPEGLQDYAGSDDPRATTAHPAGTRARKPSAHDALAIWQRYAEPVWWDIDQMRVLNIQAAREARDEKHICPLQLDVIARALHLWTNPGDLVLSPFAGIGSEGYEALLNNRRFIGFELKQSYFEQACRNLDWAETHGKAQQSLFAGEEAASTSARSV